MAKILFVGDICSHGYTKAHLSDFKKTKLFKYLNEYDGLVIGNLEAPILNEFIQENLNKFSLLNSRDNFEFYSFCDALSLANNHMFDQGYEGFIETKKFLKQLDVKCLGAGSNIDESRKPLILNLGVMKVSFLAYNCYSTNSQNNADASSYGTSPLLYDFIKEDIEALKKMKVDKIFILPHWGIENEFFPTSEQVCFARKVIDLGADGIIGSHTHCIQTDELYNGRPIFYSLGNFLFNNFKVTKEQTYYQGKFNKEGLLVELSFSSEDVLNVERKYISFNSDMIPDFKKLCELKTPVTDNNMKHNIITKTFFHKKTAPDMGLNLKYNGRSVQVVYASNPISKNIMLTYDSLLTKVKRILVYRLRKLLK
ncbi:CapA family protein [Vibrio sp. 2-Bac 85]